MLGACSDPVTAACGIEAESPGGGAPVPFRPHFLDLQVDFCHVALGTTRPEGHRKCHRQAIEFVISYADASCSARVLGTNGMSQRTSPVSSPRPSPTSRAGLTIASCTSIWCLVQGRSVSDGSGGRSTREQSSRRRPRSQAPPGCPIRPFDRRARRGWEARGGGIRPTRYEITGVPRPHGRVSQAAQSRSRRAEDELNSSFGRAHGAGHRR